ncbi:hypothetical protein SNEBB_000095 [Seison nebaliae]|nr:hypothetical protein SNEBB_000095 [Seison nebaliae]
MKNTFLKNALKLYGIDELYTLMLFKGIETGSDLLNASPEEFDEWNLNHFQRTQLNSLLRVIGDEYEKIKMRKSRYTDDSDDKVDESKTSFQSKTSQENSFVSKFSYGIPMKHVKGSKSVIRTQENYNSLTLNDVLHWNENKKKKSLNGSDCKESNIYICGRVRSSSEKNNKKFIRINKEDKTIVVVDDSKTYVDGTNYIKEFKFKFDAVYSPSSSNIEIFRYSFLPHLVKLEYDEEKKEKKKSIVFLCYGQTGSGKSYTIFGNSSSVIYSDAPVVHGIGYLTGRNLISDYPNETLWLSLYELNNSKIYDLFNNHELIHAREDYDKVVQLNGLIKLPIKTINQLGNVLAYGSRKRMSGISSKNNTSSRSHCILNMSIKNESSNELIEINFVDLAGSDRACDALKQSMKNDDIRVKDSAYINRSLLALKECIRCTDQKLPHAPWRQSKLTHILRNNLLDRNTIIILLVTAHECRSAIPVTINSFFYASRIKSFRSNFSNSVTETLIDPDEMIYNSEKAEELLLSITESKEDDEGRCSRKRKPVSFEIPPTRTREGQILKKKLNFLELLEKAEKRMNTKKESSESQTDNFESEVVNDKIDISTSTTSLNQSLMTKREERRSVFPSDIPNNSHKSHGKLEIIENDEIIIKELNDVNLDEQINSIYQKKKETMHSKYNHTYNNNNNNNNNNKKKNRRNEDIGKRREMDTIQKYEYDYEKKMKREIMKNNHKKKYHQNMDNINKTLEIIEDALHHLECTTNQLYGSQKERLKKSMENNDFQSRIDHIIKKSHILQGDQCQLSSDYFTASDGDYF